MCAKRSILTLFCVVATTAAMSSTLKQVCDSTSVPLIDGQCAIARHIDEVKNFGGIEHFYVYLPSDMSDSVPRFLFIVYMNLTPEFNGKVLSEGATLRPGTSHSAYLTIYELRSVEKLIQLVETIRECTNSKDYKEKIIQNKETPPIKKTRKLPHGVD